VGAVAELVAGTEAPRSGVASVVVLVVGPDVAGFAEAVAMPAGFMSLGQAPASLSLSPERGASAAA